MKHRFLIAIFLFNILNIQSQVGHNFLSKNLPKQIPVKSYILFQPICDVHNINMDLIKYHETQRKARLFTYYPLQKVRFTLKTGFNGKILSKINTDNLIAGDFQDAFNEVDTMDALMVMKYDARVKFYLNKKFRLLMRAQIIGFGKNNYVIGLFWKV